MPCTKIVIRHYDPIVSIIVDAAESVRPNSATETIRCSGPSIATAFKMLLSQVAAIAQPKRRRVSSAVCR
jgi:hypothetical protein